MRSIHAYRANLACTLADAAASQALLDAVCGVEELDVSGSWATRYARTGAPTVHTHNVAAAVLSPTQYAALAAGAAAAGLAHMVEAVWYTEDGGAPYEEPLELEVTLWDELGIAPLEVE